MMGSQGPVKTFKIDSHYSQRENFLLTKRVPPRRPHQWQSIRGTRLRVQEFVIRVLVCKHFNVEKEIVCFDAVFEEDGREAKPACPC